MDGASSGDVVRSEADGRIHDQRPRHGLGGASFGALEVAVRTSSAAGPGGARIWIGHRRP